MLNKFNFRSFSVSEESTPILKRYEGEYNKTEVILQILPADGTLMNPSTIEDLLVKCHDARNNLHSLGCIVGYSITPMCTYTLWSLFGHSQTLAQKIKDLNITSRVIISIGIIQALHQLHSKSIFHGSLSPYSIYLNDKNEPIIGFYGINELTASSNIKVPSILQPYIDPRVISGNHPDQVSDIYSFGQIIALLALGRPLEKDEPIDLSSAPKYFQDLYHVAHNLTKDTNASSLNETLRNEWENIKSIEGIEARVVHEYIRNKKPVQDLVITVLSSNSPKPPNSPNHPNPPKPDSELLQQSYEKLKNQKVSKENKEEAFKVIQNGVSYKIPHALNLLGCLYLDGVYVKKDLIKAEEYLVEANSLNPNSSSRPLLRLYIQTKNYDKAEPFIHSDDNERQYYILLYYKAKGDMDNYQKVLNRNLQNNPSPYFWKDLGFGYLNHNLLGIDIEIATKCAKKLQKIAENHRRNNNTDHKKWASFSTQIFSKIKRINTPTNHIIDINKEEEGESELINEEENDSEEFP